jgi:hypothetical protein
MQAWSKVKLEFSAQVLVWRSTPRRDVAALDVLLENGIEAQACSSIKRLLSLGAGDLFAPSQSIVPAECVAVLTNAMHRSIIDLSATQNYVVRLLKIPTAILSTGHIAKSVDKNSSNCEKYEIDALVKSMATREDANLVRTLVLGLPAETLEKELCIEDVPKRSTHNISTVPSRSLWESLHPVRTKIKNTFLEPESSESDEVESTNSSIRSSSTPPSWCTSSQSSDKGMDCEDLAHR